MPRSELDREIHQHIRSDKQVTAITLFGNLNGEMYFRTTPPGSFRLLNISVGEAIEPEESINTELMNRGFTVSRPPKYSGLVCLLPQRLASDRPDDKSLSAIFSATVSDYNSPPEHTGFEMTAVHPSNINSSIEYFSKGADQYSQPEVSDAMTNICIGALRSYREHLIGPNNF